MAKINDMTLTGASGQTYAFAVYSLDTDFKALGAVYFMTKRTKKPDGNGGSHEMIYVGETGDLSGRPLNHHKKDCFDRKGANCVCVHLQSNDSQRLAIEADLLKAYKPSCND